MLNKHYGMPCYTEGNHGVRDRRRGVTCVTCVKREGVCEPPTLRSCINSASDFAGAGGLGGVAAGVGSM